MKGIQPSDTAEQLEGFSFEAHRPLRRSKEKEENPEEKKEEKEEELEAILFSRSAVTNSFFNKLISGKPEKKVNISELEKRLSLLKP